MCKNGKPDRKTQMQKSCEPKEPWFDCQRSERAFLLTKDERRHVFWDTSQIIFVRELLDIDIPLCGCLKDFSDPVDVVEVSTSHRPSPSIRNESAMAGGATAESLDLDLRPIPLTSNVRRYSLRATGSMAAATVQSLDIKLLASNTHRPFSKNESAMAGGTIQCLDFQPMLDESLLERTDASSSFLRLGERIWYAAEGFARKSANNINAPCSQLLQGSIRILILLQTACWPSNVTKKI